MKKTKEIRKENQGITLVALVITIIVLLILAGVGISALTGENGLIEKARQAAEGYNQASRGEVDTINSLLNSINTGENLEEMPESTTTLVTLEAQFPMMESDNICPDSFKLKATGVDEEKGVVSYKFYINGSLYSTQETTEETCIINVTGREEETSYNCYVIVINGAGEIKQSETIEVTTIASIATIEKINDYPLGYYGKEVIYTPQNEASEDWKIFYADEENIYLIASDYIGNTYAPNAANGTEIDIEDTYLIYFEKIVDNNAYTGTVNIQQEDERVKKWISHINTFTSEYGSMKATAYLLDTDVWSGFKDTNNKAEYAIGAPTLELFIASYNNTHSENTIDYELLNENGYAIKWTKDLEYSGQILGLNIEE